MRRQMDETARLVRVARAGLGSAGSGASSDGATRRMLEAANYLDFIVEDFAASGEVDGTLAQFAARELNAAGSGVGGTPLNC